MKLLRLLLISLVFVIAAIATGCTYSNDSSPKANNSTIEGSWIALSQTTIKTVKIEKLGEQYLVTAKSYDLWHEPLFNNETAPVDVTFRGSTTYNQRQASLKNNQLDILQLKTFYVLENGTLKGKITKNASVLAFERLNDDSKAKIIEKAKELHVNILKKQDKDTNRLKFKLDATQIQ